MGPKLTFWPANNKRKDLLRVWVLIWSLLNTLQAKAGYVKRKYWNYLLLEIRCAVIRSTYWFEKKNGCSPPRTHVPHIFDSLRMQHRSHSTAQSPNNLMRAATSPGVSRAPPPVAHNSPHHHHHHHHHPHRHQCDEAAEDGDLPALRHWISPQTGTEPFYPPFNPLWKQSDRRFFILYTTPETDFVPFYKSN